MSLPRVGALSHACPGPPRRQQVPPAAPALEESRHAARPASGEQGGWEVVPPEAGRGPCPVPYASCTMPASEPERPAGVRRPALPATPPLSQMQSTYVLQGLHLHIPSIFPNYPSNNSGARGAPAGGYKVRRGVCSQGRPGVLPPRRGGNEAASELPSPHGRVPSGRRKHTWRVGGLCHRLATLPGGPTAPESSGQGTTPPAALSGLAARLVPPPLCLFLSGPCLSPGLSKPAPWHLRAGRRMAYRPPTPFAARGRHH